MNTFDKLNNRRLALKQIGAGSVGLLAAPLFLFFFLIMYSVKETILNGSDVIQDVSNIKLIYLPWVLTSILGIWVFPQYDLALALVKHTTDEITNVDIKTETRRCVAKWQNLQIAYLFCEVAAWFVFVGVYCHFNANTNGEENIRRAVTWACYIMLLNLSIFIRIIFIFSGRKFIRELDNVAFDESETYRQNMLYHQSQEL